MNAFTAFLHRLTSRGPGLIFGCAAIGLMAGVVGGMVHYSLQPRVFESHAFLYPVGATPVRPDLAWMDSEAGAMRQRQSLEEVARRINMSAERKMSVPGCVDLLENSVSVTIATLDDSGAMTGRRNLEDTYKSGFSVLRIGMQGDNSAECAAVVNALIGVREDAWLAAERNRLESDPARKSRIGAKSAECKQLLEKSKELRAALVAGLPAAGVHDAGISNLRLESLQLTGLLQTARNEWLQTHKAWEHASAELDSAPPLRPYAVVLQQAKTSVDPIGPEWRSFGWLWIAGSVAAGIIAGLAFRQIRAWKEVNLPAPVLPPATAVEF